MYPPLPPPAPALSSLLPRLVANSSKRSFINWYRAGSQDPHSLDAFLTAGAKGRGCRPEKITAHQQNQQTTTWGPVKTDMSHWQSRTWMWNIVENTKRFKLLPPWPGKKERNVSVSDSSFFFSFFAWMNRGAKADGLIPTSTGFPCYLHR